MFSEPGLCHPFSVRCRAPPHARKRCPRSAVRAGSAATESPQVSPPFPLEPTAPAQHAIGHPARTKVPRPPKILFSTGQVCQQKSNKFLYPQAGVSRKGECSASASLAERAGRGWVADQSARRDLVHTSATSPSPMARPPWSTSWILFTASAGAVRLHGNASSSWTAVNAHLRLHCRKRPSPLRLCAAVLRSLGQGGCVRLLAASRRPTYSTRKPGWRNGRRWGLKIPWASAHVGSIPTPGTNSRPGTCDSSKNPRRQSGGGTGD